VDTVRAGISISLFVPLTAVRLRRGRLERSVVDA